MDRSERSDRLKKWLEKQLADHQKALRIESELDDMSLEINAYIDGLSMKIREALQDIELPRSGHQKADPSD